VNILLQLDFRTPFFQGNHEALLALHPGDFVFVEHRDKPRILHITSYGTPEWIDRPFALGSGAMFAYALLQKYRAVPLTLEQATLLAFKVIEEAIEVGAYGLGPPIEIWHVLQNSLERLDEAKLAAVKDTTSQIRDREIQLLLGEPIGWNDESPARAGEEESREGST
jgi:proteasome beta subunit